MPFDENAIKPEIDSPDDNPPISFHHQGCHG